MAMKEPDTVVVVVIAEVDPVQNFFAPSFGTMVNVWAFCNQLGSDQTSTSLVARYPAQATTAVNVVTKVTAGIENLS